MEEKVATLTKHYDGIITLQNKDTVGVKIGEEDNKVIVTVVHPNGTPIILNFEKDNHHADNNVTNKQDSNETIDINLSEKAESVPIDYKSDTINKKLRSYNDTMTKMTGRSSFILAKLSQKYLDFISESMYYTLDANGKTTYFSNDSIFLIVDYLTRTEQEGVIFPSSNILNLNKRLFAELKTTLISDYTMSKYVYNIRDFFLDWKKFASVSHTRSRENFLEPFVNTHRFYIYSRCYDLGLHNIMSIIYHKTKTKHHCHYSWVDLTKNNGGCASTFIFKNSKSEQDDLVQVMGIVSDFCSRTQREGSYCLHLTMRELIKEIMKAGVNPTTTEYDVAKFIMKIIHVIQPKNGSFRIHRSVKNFNTNPNQHYNEVTELFLKIKQNGKDLMIYRTISAKKL